MRVFLLGFMGSGKTTAGEKLAKKTGLNFIDLDNYIERKNNTTIRLLMEQGEDIFRQYEKRALEDVIKEHDNVVVSTGGGTPCFFDNLKLMNESGVTIYLEIDIPTIVNRLMNSKADRPLVWGKSKDDLKVYIKELLSKRQDFYRKANHIIDGKDLKIESLEELLDLTRD